MGDYDDDPTASDDVIESNPLLHAENADDDDQSRRGSVAGEDEKIHPERVLGTLGLASIIFFEVGGGIGMDEAVRHGGVFWALLGIVVFPFVFSIPLALITAELSTTYPMNGGQVYWVQQAFGMRMGFLQGTMSFCGNVVDGATLGVLAVQYLDELVGTLGTGRPKIFVGMCVVALAGILNLRSVKLLENSSMVFAVLAVVPLFCVVLIGLPDVKPSIWMERRPIQGVQVGRLLSLLMWNNSGYDLAGSCAGEVKNPGEVLPKALGLSVLLSTSCYLFPIAVAVCTPAGRDTEKWTDDYLSTDIPMGLGGMAFKVVACVFASVSAVGMVCNTVMASSREMQYMGLCGMMPKVFGALHPAFGTPHWSILCICVITVLMIIVPFDPLVEISTVCSCICYVAEFIAFVALRKTSPHRKRPFEVPGGMVGAAAISVLPVAGCVITIVTATKWTLIITAVYAGIVMLYYNVYGASRIMIVPEPDD